MVLVWLYGFESYANDHSVAAFELEKFAESVHQTNIRSTRFGQHRPRPRSGVWAMLDGAVKGAVVCFAQGFAVRA